MGRNDHFADTPLELELRQCKKCKQYYKCEETEQIPGFREMDEEICPYCGNIIQKSMTYEFLCTKLTKEEVEYLVQKGKLNK